MSSNSRQPTGPNRFARNLFADLPARYDRLGAILSFGQDRVWRREMVGHVVDATPGHVLDVATGSAGVALQLARRSDARVTGVDVSDDMLRRGRANVAEASLDGRITLALGRAEELPFRTATFDALTFTYLLRYVADPGATMAELARVVRPGGAVASLEFAVPTNPVLRTAWWCYTRALLPVGGALLGGRPWFDVGRFLGPSISRHHRDHPVDSIVAAWEAAGIEDVRCKRMSLGGGLVMWGRRSP